MTDVITRHDRNGAVLFISPTAEQMLGAKAENLHGQGLFDRVHVTDRPGYLKALADAAADGGSRSVEFRVRRPTGEIRWCVGTAAATVVATSATGARRNTQVVAVLYTIPRRASLKRSV